MNHSSYCIPLQSYKKVNSQGSLSITSGNWSLLHIPCNSMLNAQEGAECQNRRISLLWSEILLTLPSPKSFQADKVEWLQIHFFLISFQSYIEVECSSRITDCTLLNVCKDFLARYFFCKLCNSGKHFPLKNQVPVKTVSTVQQFHWRKGMCCGVEHCHGHLTCVMWLPGGKMEHHRALNPRRCQLKEAPDLYALLTKKNTAN